MEGSDRWPGLYREGGDLDAVADELQTSDTNPTPHATAESFDACVGPHLPMLLRAAGSLCRNPHDAEDLAQDTLVRAFNGLDGFDGAYPRAWLLTIMRNANINRHRRQRPALLHDATDLAGEDYRRLKLALADTSAPIPNEPHRLQALAAGLASGDTSPA